MQPRHFPTLHIAQNFVLRGLTKIVIPKIGDTSGQKIIEKINGQIFGWMCFRFQTSSLQSFLSETIPGVLAAEPAHQRA